jgi:hypothetical protein
MRRYLLAAGFGIICLTGPVQAFAQRFPFEQTVTVDGPVILDATTIRGRIDVVAGEPGRVVIAGTVTVRVGWDVPANAEALARQVASAPPIERVGKTIRLDSPSDPAALRAVTVSYQVRVPVDTEAHTTSESGATTVRGLSGAVLVRTQSAAIDLGSLAGPVEVTTGSGAVTVQDVRGMLKVTTGSSEFTGRGLGSSLYVRTQSGQVDAELTGGGDVDVETGSSAIRVHGLRGALTAVTQSGRIAVRGMPARDWSARTGSSSVEMIVDGTGFNVDIESRSGNVIVDGEPVKGEVSKHRVAGTVGAGGPLIRVNSGSGSIQIHVR